LALQRTMGHVQITDVHKGTLWKPNNDLIWKW